MPKARKPLKPPKPLEPPDPPPAPDPDRALMLPKLLAAARGARLCYGEPVEVAGRTVIPVARVRAAGGLGQRGGGGRLDADPVGFIDVSVHGTRFEAITPVSGPARVLAAAGTAVAGLATAVALRRRRPALRARPRRRSLPR